MQAIFERQLGDETFIISNSDKRKVSVYQLPTHPRACPVTDRNRVKSCTTLLDAEAYKTGCIKGHGQWKKYCPKHGLVIYDLIEGE